MIKGCAHGQMMSNIPGQTRPRVELNPLLKRLLVCSLSCFCRLLLFRQLATGLPLSLGHKLPGLTAFFHECSATCEGR